MKKGAGVLVVEDDRLDAKNLLRAFRRSGLDNPLIFVADGEEALEWLREAAEGSSQVQLVLLDLQLPKMGGFGFLESYRADAQLRQIPVVVVSTSRSPSDIQQAYRLGAAGYLAKSLRFEDFSRKIRAMVTYLTECEPTGAQPGVDSGALTRD